MTEATSAKRPAHKVSFSTNEQYGERRLRLGAIVAGLLEREGIQSWSLDSGTLLGAWRNGRQIPADDDIDFLIYVAEYRPAFLEALITRLRPLLPEPYECRVVTSYCHKLEFFDPTEGMYALVGDIYGGADYHHVTCDLQVYCDRETDSNLVQMLHDNGDHLPIPRSLMVFDATIELEGETFRCPGDPKGFLSCLYGYLGADAVFNPITKLYDKVASDG